MTSELTYRTSAEHPDVVYMKMRNLVVDEIEYEFPNFESVVVRPMMQLFDDYPENKHGEPLMMPDFYSYKHDGYEISEADWLLYGDIVSINPANDFNHPCPCGCEYPG